MTGFFATYAGLVEDVNDPEELGRVRVRVPLVYGPSGGIVSTSDLPWASPAGLPAGSSPQSGGISWLPVKGDQVCVRFIDGEPEQPRWEWGVQTRGHKQTLPLHRYEGGKPSPRGLLTRYGHAFEFSPSGITAVTSKGYYTQLIDAGDAQDGYWKAQTAKGYFIALFDESDQAFINTRFFTALFQSMDFTGDDVTFDVTNVVNVNCPRINLGTSASDPVVRKSDLQRALNTVMRWANSHTHPKVSPPNVQLSVTAGGSPVTFSA